MTISFRSTIVDTWHQTSYLMTKTVLGQGQLILLLVLPFIGPSFLLHHSVPGSEVEHLMKAMFWPAVALTYVAVFFSMLLCLFSDTANTLATTVKIDPQYCYIRNLKDASSPWRHFARIVEEPDYFFFTGWRRFACIPKSAFASRAEADAFYQAALGFWREAKGVMPPPVPDTASIWPPAPRPGNSAEPGDTPQC